MKIAYLVDQEISDYNLKRWGCNELIDLDNEIYFISVYELILGAKNLKHYSRYDQFNYINIKNFFDIVKLFKLSDINFYIDSSGYNTKTFIVRFILSSYLKINRVVFHCGSFPIHRSPVKNNLLFRFKNFSLSSYLTKFSEVLQIFLFKPSIFFADSIAALSNRNHKYSKLVGMVHSYDYELYLNYLNKNLNLNNLCNNAVYIDQAIGYHSDYVYRAQKQIVSIDKFYSKINNFFIRIKEHIGQNICISLHPRSDICFAKNIFDNGFLIKKNHTLESVSCASVLLAHYSTAIQFGIFFNKPIVLLVDSDIINSDRFLHIKLFSEELGLSILNIDEPFNPVIFNSSLQFSKNSYLKYILTYCKFRNIQDQSMWLTVNNLLRSYE